MTDLELIGYVRRVYGAAMALAIHGVLTGQTGGRFAAHVRESIEREARSVSTAGLCGLR